LSERRILAALLSDRNVYDSISPVMDIADDFDDKGGIIATHIKQYYENDEHAEAVDRQFLIDQLRNEYPKHGDFFEGIVKSLTPVSIPNALAEYRTLKLQSTQKHLAEALVSKDETAISNYLDKYNHYRDMSNTTDEGTVFVDTDIDQVLASFQKENLIKVHPSILNEKLGGGLVPGVQIAIYAPTEVGKSMLAINMAAGFMHDGRKVLYCGNEDAAMVMLSRFYSRLSGMDRDTMIQHKAEARRRALENGYSNLVFYEMDPGSIFGIKAMVEKHKPDILIVDQMANMDTRGNFTKVEKNEYLSVRLRSMGKKHGLVNIILHQASDSAYGKLAIEKNDMYYSNVGVQGQMDVMIGMGMDEVFHQQGKRMLCLTKNKLNSDHSHIPVRVDERVSKVSNIGETQ